MSKAPTNSLHISQPLCVADYRLQFSVICAELQRMYIKRALMMSFALLRNIACPGGQSCPAGRLV